MTEKGKELVGEFAAEKADEYIVAPVTDAATAALAGGLGEETAGKVVETAKETAVEAIEEKVADVTAEPDAQDEATADRPEAETCQQISAASGKEEAKESRTEQTPKEDPQVKQLT